MFLVRENRRPLGREDVTILQVGVLHSWVQDISTLMLVRLAPPPPELPRWARSVKITLAISREMRR